VIKAGDSSSRSTAYFDPNEKNSNYITVSNSKLRGTISAPIDMRSFTAYQSSEGWDGKPYRAIDGNTNQQYGGNSCTHTQADLHSWWYVDLLDSHYVNTVKTYNRLDCCSERLANYKVYVGNNPEIMKNPTCPGTHTDSKTITCDLEGRYVGIALEGQNYLTLCEVEVFEWV